VTNLKETRVGHATTAILEELCKETIIEAWKNKDYSLMVDYLAKYEPLHKYNKG